MTNIQYLKKNLPALISEKELVLLLQQRNHLAAAVLYRQYSVALRLVIWRILHDDELTSEVLQTTFSKVWEKTAYFNSDKGGLYNWMVNIARNLSMDILRGQIRKATMVNCEELSDKLIVSNSHYHTINIDRIGLHALVSGLKQEEQEVIRLQFLEGYTQPEVAKKLNMPLGTVKTRSRNGLISLRKYFVAA